MHNCTKCGTPHASKGPLCRKCNTAKCKAHYHSAKSVAKREAARQTKLLKQNAYYAANKEQMKSDNLARYHANREKYRLQRKYKQEQLQAMGTSMAKEWHKANPRKSLRLRLKKYGMSLEDYDIRMQHQENTCALCHEPLLLPIKPGEKSTICVDHDHVTGKVRGIVHTKCNILLGMCCDSVSRLKQAIVYLQNSNTEDSLEQGRYPYEPSNE